MMACGIGLLDTLTVLEAAVPVVGEKPPECPADEAEDWLWKHVCDVDDPLGHFAIVVEGNNTIGWFGIETFPGKGARVEKVVRHGPNVTQTVYSRDYPIGEAWALETSQIVSSDTTLFELLELLTCPPPNVLFVLRGRKITHSVTFRDLASAPSFRMGIFSLLLALESAILDAAKISPEEAWKCLSSKQRKRVHSTFKNLHGIQETEDTPPDEEHKRRQWFMLHLECTTYNHKVIMATKSDSIKHRLPLGPPCDAEDFLDLTRRMRNAIAHGDPLLEVNGLERESLLAVLEKAQVVINALSA